MHCMVVTLGGSPMPVYMTLAYLLLPTRTDGDVLPMPQHVIFLCTSRTRLMIPLITDLLPSQTFEMEVIDLGDNERRYDVIREKIQKHLHINQLFQSIHLHYTSGTKPMAVAASCAIEEQVEGTDTKTIYSDFDPHKSVLTLRTGESYPKEDIGQFITLTIDEIYRLHDHEIVSLRRAPSPEHQLPLLSLLMEDFMGEEDTMRSWDSWPKQSSCKKVRKFFREAQHPMNEAQVVTKANALLSLVGEEASLEKLDAPTCKLLARLSRYICGGWLEEYLFEILQTLKIECGLTDLAWNIVGRKRGREFEVDIVAVRGVRTYLFTCTTSKRVSLCKVKAFEGTYRARQLGGLEAKSILVCGLDVTGIESIESDMSEFSVERHFSAIGMERLGDTAKLHQKLVTIFESTERGEKG